MSDVNAPSGAPGTDNATVLRLLQAAKSAGAAGRATEADQLLARVAQLAPTHPAVLNELGLQMLARGEAGKACELFRRATRADPKHPNLWSNLASSLHALNQLPEELDAIERALALEPRHLAALLQKGALMEATGDPRNAARVYRNALATLAPGATPPETVAAVIEHARAAVAQDEAALAAAIEQRLAGDQGRPWRRTPPARGPLHRSSHREAGPLHAAADLHVLSRSFRRSSSSIARTSRGWMRSRRRAMRSARS